MTHNIHPKVSNDGPDQVAALKQAVQAADAVARGTEVHVQLSVRAMQKQRSACAAVSAADAEVCIVICYEIRGPAHDTLGKKCIYAYQQPTRSFSGFDFKFDEQKNCL
eukprot:1159687-Pelagomonas_calceolata.AAC.3